MFIDKEKEKREEVSQGLEQKISPTSFLNSRNIAIIAVVFAALAVGIFFVIKSQLKPEEKSGGIVATPAEEETTEQSTTTPGVSSILPGHLGDGTPVGIGDGTALEDIEAEYLSFGHFYKIEEGGFEARVDSYQLPVNIKVDVSNYYDISRKINLDPYLDQLNTNGFVILENPFPEKMDDFYSGYDLLDQMQVPLIITSDFLIYYYQNVLKQVFKDIEQDVFYQNVWEINKKLFDIASTRYKKRFAITGIANDPVLEGERLESAYFAVTLELLKPTAEQINLETFIDESKFNQQEADFFDFILPDHLKLDVVEEVNLIRQARQEAKSPIFLQERDYNYFIVPNDYKSNAKLYNFYLATKWMNSLFPLYYQSETCPDCLLDEDDWLINIIAASLIAKDFSDNQDLENQWAIIYKVISFFSGLRSDLTYLHYQDAFKNLFGDDYKIEDIFSFQNQAREELLKKIQEKIFQYEFSQAEGSFDRNDIATKPLLGMRILQEFYWPDYYIFSQLIDPQVTFYAGDSNQLNKELNVTVCEEARQRIQSRCRGIGLDIINLIYPVSTSNNYFKENISYQNYQEQITKLRNQLDKFNVYSWHNNNFWTTISMVKSFLHASNTGMPVFTQRESWKDKDVNTALGAWVNLQLPMDKFIPYSLKAEKKLGMFPVCNSYNYIEPNLVLTQELIANTNMLLEMLTALKVSQGAPSVSINLKELEKKLDNAERIIKKELQNQILDKDDCEFIIELAKQFSVKEKGSKDIKINFKTNQTIRESIEGIKLLIVVYQHNDKKVFAVGPVFNYEER